MKNKYLSKYYIEIYTAIIVSLPIDWIMIHVLINFDSSQKYYKIIYDIALLLVCIFFYCMIYIGVQTEFKDLARSKRKHIHEQIANYIQKYGHQVLSNEHTYVWDCVIACLVSDSLIPKVDVLSRKSSKSWHITATALVVNKAGTHYAVVHHKALNKILFPGGHLEKYFDTIIYDAANEAKEELGIKVASLCSNSPIDIDIHFIPRNPDKGEEAHYHFDLMYAFTTVDDKFNSSDKGVSNQQWYSFDDVQYRTPHHQKRLKNYLNLLDVH